MQKIVDYKRKESIFEYWRKLETEPLFEDYKVLLRTHPLLKSLSQLTNSAFLILDHVNSRYAYAHESLEAFSGYPIENFMENGWVFTKKVVPQVYYDFSSSICNRLVFEFLYELPIEMRDQYLFSKDYLYRKRDGTFSHVFQKGMVLKSDSNGNIQLTLHIVTDITHIKKEDTGSLILVGPNNQNHIYSFEIKSQILSDHGSMTRRETEILALLAQKMDTKHIAAKLFLSPHTVDQHRRNLLKKLNCVDTTGLVTYCKMCGLL
jgi:DNA-binding CsgD family transcriptional regulator